MKKQAVVYVVDASETMQSCPLVDASLAPWQVAQHAVTVGYGAVLQHSAASLASILVARTAQSFNHKYVHEDEDDEESENDDNNNDESLHEFAHLRELTFGMTKTSVETLRQWQDCRTEGYSGSGGTILDALKLAAASLEAATAAKQYNRAIYVYTDAAGHDYEITIDALQTLIASLQALECPVHVVLFQSLLSNENVPMKSESSSTVAVKKEPSSEANEFTAATVKQKDNTEWKDTPDAVHPSPPPKSSARSLVKLESAAIKQESDDKVMPASPVKSGTKIEKEKYGDDSATDIHASPVKSSRNAPNKEEQRIKTEKMDDESVTDDEEMHPSPVASKRIKVESDANDEEQQYDSDEEEEDVVVLDSRLARDEFLQSLAAQTNGTYRAVYTLADLFGSVPSLEDAGVEPLQKDPHYAKTTLLLTPAKGTDVAKEPYAIPVRLSLMHAKQGAPTLKKGALVIQDNQQQPQYATTDSQVPVFARTEQGGYDIRDTVKLSKFVKLDDPDGEIFNADVTTKAVRYGSEWKVVDTTFDQATIPKDLPGPAIQMIGVMEKERLPDPYASGPCHTVTGHDSLKACAAVTALAQALRETDKIALVLCAKTKLTVATTLGALVPGAKNQLYMITLPYACEVKTLDPEDWRDPDVDEQVAADLIDALWLSDEQADAIINQSDPFQRAVQTTLLHRAVHPSSCEELKFPRCLDDQDPLGTPVELKENAQGPITKFREAFPLVLKSSTDKEKKKQGQKALTYTNFVHDDEA